LYRHSSILTGCIEDCQYRAQPADFESVNVDVTTFFGALGVLLPVVFVIGLGFWAGRTKRFDSDQVAGLNELVLDFAFPALLFVGIARASRDTLFADGPYVVALLVATLGLFLVVASISVFVLRHSIGAAAIQAACVTYSNASFAGIPILTPLFGASSLFAIAIAAMILNVTIVPVMVTMLEYDKQRAGGGADGLAALIRRSVFGSLTRPYVVAPMLATVFVLLGLHIPQEIDSMLALIGSATSGVALFVAGIILATYQLRMTPETLGNVTVKMFVQPVLMAGLVMAFAIAKPLGSEATLICAISTAVMCPMLAMRYKVYEAEAASTFLLTTVAMIVTIPIAIALTGRA
jgi:malonate transporter and related proteins